MKAYLISSVRKITEVDVEKQAIVKDFKVHLRDLRPILTQKQVATILRRKDTIIVNIQDVKLVIGKKKALLLVSEKKPVTEFLELIQAFAEASFKKLPFEFFMIDRAFVFALQKINKDFEKLSKAIHRTLPLLSDHPTDENLEKLLEIKRQLTRNETAIKDIDDLLEKFLESENLAELSFAARPSSKDLDEIESIIENLYEQIERIKDETEDLDEYTHHTEEILTLKIDSKRNRIIRFNLLATYIGTIFAFMAMITGVFGMNLLSGYEADPDAFMMVILVLLFIFIFFGIGIWIYLTRKKIL